MNMKLNRDQQALLIKTYPQFQALSGLKVGDRVRVTRKAEKWEMGWDNSWVEQMDHTVGKTAKITSISDKDVYLSNCRGYGFPFFVLEKVKVEPVKVKISDEYTAIVTPDGITVGCQENIPFDVLDKLIAARNKVLA